MARWGGFDEHIRASQAGGTTLLFRGVRQDSLSHASRTGGLSCRLCAARMRALSQHCARLGALRGPRRRFARPAFPCGLGVRESALADLGDAGRSAGSDPNLPTFPNLAEVGLVAVESGSNPPEFGHVREVCQSRSNVDKHRRSLVGIGRVVPQWGRRRPKLDQARPNLSPNLGPKSANIGRLRPTVGSKCLARIRRGWADVGQGWAELGQVGQRSTGVGQIRRGGPNFGRG